MGVDHDSLSFSAHGRIGRRHQGLGHGYCLLVELKRPTRVSAPSKYVEVTQMKKSKGMNQWWQFPGSFNAAFEEGGRFFPGSLSLRSMRHWAFRLPCGQTGGTAGKSSRLRSPSGQA